MDKKEGGGNFLKIIFFDYNQLIINNKKIKINFNRSIVIFLEDIMPKKPISTK